MFLRKLGKRGAEMVEYAIVLACIAAVGVGFYSSNDSKLTGVLDSLFGKVTNVISLGSGVSPNGAPLTDNDKIALKGQTTIMYDTLTSFLSQNNQLGNEFKRLVALELDDKGELKSAWYENNAGELAQLQGNKFDAAKNNLKSNWGQMQNKDGVTYKTSLHGFVTNTAAGKGKTSYVAYNPNGNVTGSVTGYTGEVYNSISGMNTNLWLAERNNSAVAQYIYSNQYGAFEKYPNGATSSTN